MLHTRAGQLTAGLVSTVVALTAAGPTQATAGPIPATQHVSAQLLPATAPVSSTVTLTGTTAPGAAKAALAVERLTGQQWRVIARTRTTAAGTYLIHLRAPASAAAWTLRVTTASTAGNKTGTSAAVHLRVTHSVYAVTAATAPTVVAAAPILVKGTVRPRATGSVEVQVLLKQTWQHWASAKLSATSSYTVSSARPAGSYRLRVVKPFSTKVAAGTSKAFTVHVLPLIAAPESPTVTTTALPAAMITRPYSQTLAASGGTGPYAWAVTGLPVGLVAGSTGTITGTPTTAGASSLVVTVTDSVGHTGSATLPLTVAVLSGSVLAWGTNADGELGNGTVTDSLTPTPVSGLTQVTAVASASYASYALLADGTVWSWGSNSFGQLGIGSTADQHVPVQISGLTGVTALAAGEGTGYALKADGTVWAWGESGTGQIGDNGSANRPTPVQVSGLAGVVQIAATSLNGYALTSDGTVWEWGSAQLGALGDGQVTVPALVPEHVPGLGKAAAIYGGGGPIFAVLADGTVRAWGDNTYGNTGTGTTNGVLSPTIVTGLVSVVAVSGNSSNSYALHADGTVSAWGTNMDGGLGNGLTANTNVTTATTVPGLTGVTALSAHGYAVTALRSDGSVDVWGFDGFKGLGLATVANVSTPTPLGPQGAVFLPGGTLMSQGLAVVVP